MPTHYTLVAENDTLQPFTCLRYIFYDEGGTYHYHRLNSTDTEATSSSQRRCRTVLLPRYKLHKPKGVAHSSLYEEYKENSDHVNELIRLFTI